MNCVLEIVETRADGRQKHRCIHCLRETGWLRPGVKYHRTCGPPSMFSQAASFAKSMAEWAAAGLPILNQEQVAERWQKCESCTHRREEICLLCGCPVNSSIDRPNKLILGTEVCPHDPPFWSAKS